MDNDRVDCVFCFDKINQDDIDLNIIEQEQYIKDKIISDEVEEYTNMISQFLNSNLKLYCNHRFHLGCFVKYLKHKYISWSNKPRKCCFTLECPFCRKTLPVNQILNIIDTMKFMKIFEKCLKNKLIKIRFKLFLSKLKLYWRKLTLSKSKDVYDYFILIETYDELEFILDKIKHLCKNLNSIYKDIEENCDYDYDHYYNYFV